METKLDLRQPTLVVAGAWNERIINEPGWIAQHVLEIEAGLELELSQIVGREMPIFLYEKFGIRSQMGRLEFFERNTSEVEMIYDALNKLAKKLPHTPIAAVGVNFAFALERDTEATIPLLGTSEQLDSIGNIRESFRSDIFILPSSESFSLEEQSEPGIQLRFDRKTDYKTMQLNLNYNQMLSSTENLSKWIATRPIYHWKKHAEKFLREIYGIDGFSEIYF